jgi:L-threonylcarbamoyladenylate synthase
VEEIERVIGPLQRAIENPDRPEAPGQLIRHYAPRTPLFLCDTPPATPDSTKAGLLAFGPPENPHAFASIEMLAEDGNLRDAATRLFAAMHRLDALNLDVIYAQKVPDMGLGRAINDRLRRAAHPHQTFES